MSHDDLRQYYGDGENTGNFKPHATQSQRSIMNAYEFIEERDKEKGKAWSNCPDGLAEALREYASMKLQESSNNLYSIPMDQLIDRLSNMYHKDCLAIASLCDEVLDHSGGLLGKVRKHHEKIYGYLHEGSNK